MDSPGPAHDPESRFELQTVLETSRLLAESHDMDFVLNNLLLITMGKLLVSRGAVLLFEPAGGGYIISKSKGKTELAEGDAVAFEQPEDLQDCSVIESGKTELDLPVLFAGDESYTLFNLRTRSDHIGFLCLGAKGDGSPLKPHEIDFVESLSIISSVAIANSRMFSQLKETNRMLDRKIYELNTLLDLSKDFNRMVDREEISRVFKFAMLGQLMIRRFFFVLEQDQGRSLAAKNSIEGRMSRDTMDTLFELTDDIAEVDDECREEIPFLRKNDIRAVISLYFQNKKMAVVGIGPKANGEPYSESDFNFLQSLGNIALLSIQKTLLLEERIEKERLEEELNIARSIQQGLLPDPLPSHPALDIAARNVPTLQVGGDYFDVLVTPQNRLLFAIGDVTGKGTPAALLMANIQAMLHVLLPMQISLKKATARINQMIYQNTPSDKFVTFFWGLFDPSNQQFRYVNAGHNPPLLFRKDADEAHELQEGGLILGAMPGNTEYRDKTVTLEGGDLIVFYTDGVTEAMNEDQSEEFGQPRLHDCINRHRQESSEAITQAVIDEVNAFSGARQFDDITLIVLKVK